MSPSIERYLKKIALLAMLAGTAAPCGYRHILEPPWVSWKSDQDKDYRVRI
jgi:hypothetical protein